MIPKLVPFGEEAMEAIFIQKRPALVLYEDNNESETFKTFEVACNKSSVLCVHTDGQDEKLNLVFGTGDLTLLRAI